MFICQLCQRKTEPGEKMTKVVVRTRPVVYLSGREEISRGSEIVREAKVCVPCAEKRTGSQNPLVRKER
jgi:hypothetical protein